MTASRSTMRRWAVIAQSLLSLALLAWLVRSVDWRSLLEAMRQVSPVIVAVGVSIYYAGVLLSCIKWRAILAFDALQPPLVRLLRWYLIGAFASNFLPTDIGGDLGRGLLAGRATGRPVAIARSIIVERLSGLLFLLLLGWIGALTLLPGRTLLLALSGAALLVVATAWIAARRVPAVTASLHALTLRLPPSVRQVGANSRVLLAKGLAQPGSLAGILGLSLAFQLLAGFGIWLNMSAVGLSLPLWPVILASALASVASLLPVAVNGWGLREGVLVALLSQLGAPASTVLAGALLARALVLVCSLVGAALLPLEAQTAHHIPKI